MSFTEGVLWPVFQIGSSIHQKESHESLVSEPAAYHSDTVFQMYLILGWETAKALRFMSG